MARPPNRGAGDRPRPAWWAMALLAVSAAFLLLALALLFFRAGPSWRSDPAHTLSAVGAPVDKSLGGANSRCQVLEDA